MTELLSNLSILCWYQLSPPFPTWITHFWLSLLTHNDTAAWGSGWSRNSIRITKFFDRDGSSLQRIKDVRNVDKSSHHTTACMCLGLDTCKQPDMLLDGCRVCPKCQDSTLWGTDADSCTAVEHVASLPTLKMTRLGCIFRTNFRFTQMYRVNITGHLRNYSESCWVTVLGLDSSD